MNVSTLECKDDVALDEMIDLDMQIFRAIKHYDLANMGSPAIKVIVARLNLEPFMEFLAGFNKSNYLPYHNAYHATCVMLNVYEGYYHQNVAKNVDNPPDPYDGIDEVLRGLCAGALLHDFNHTGGRQSDEENIKLALQGLETAQKLASSKLLGLSEISFKTACQVIGVTQYPFIREPFTIPEMIMRDADLMQPYETHKTTLLKQYLGLKQEVELQHGFVYSKEDFAKGQRAWQDDNVVWCTEWATKKAEVKGWEMVKANLEKLLGGS